jgi:glycosyltransferase involved in cell wall biosynthesis
VKTDCEVGVDPTIKSGIAVVFIGPIAGEGEPAKGGFESANRRTITLVKRHGVEVLELPYPDASGPAWIKTFVYLRGFARIAWTLLRRSGTFQLVHITPLRRQFIVPELLLCRLAKVLKKSLLVDLRAGQLVTSYSGRGRLHRRCLAAMVASAEIVGSEGSSYVPFLVKTLKAARVVYLPNFTTIPGRRNEARFDHLDRLNIVMLGRVAPEKGTGLGIETVRILCNANVPVRLTIIGTAPAAYAAFLRERAMDLPVIIPAKVTPTR